MVAHYIFSLGFFYGCYCLWYSTITELWSSIKKTSCFLLPNSVRLTNLSYILQLFSIPILFFNSFFGHSKDVKSELEFNDSVYLKDFAKNKQQEVSRYSQHCDSVFYSGSLSINDNKSIVEDNSIHNNNFYETPPLPKEKTLWELAKEWWFLSIGIVITIICAIISFFSWVFRNWEWIVCFLPNALRKKLKKWFENKANVL